MYNSYFPYTYIGRPEKYKHWDESKLYKAFLSVKENGTSVRRAAEMYSVPKSTLQDGITGRVPFGSERYLNEEEEEELVGFIEGCSDIGYSRTQKQIIELVQLVMDEKGRDVEVSLGWWRRRHPHLALRTAEPVSYARSIGTRPEIICRYFDLLAKTLIENDLLHQPCNIFNMDETGMPNAPKVLAKKY